jgi:hypothetical protein
MSWCFVVWDSNTRSLYFRKVICKELYVLFCFQKSHPPHECLVLSARHFFMIISTQLSHLTQCFKLTHEDADVLALTKNAPQALDGLENES